MQEHPFAVTTPFQFVIRMIKLPKETHKPKAVHSYDVYPTRVHIKLKKCGIVIIP